MKRREQLTKLEQLYYLEIIKGLFVTGSKFFVNLITYLLSCCGLNSKRRPWVTIEYPDAKRVYPQRYRGRHRLTLDEKGNPKCTSCYLCATACPAKCIYIEAGEHADPSIEKFPRRYEIDTLLCIYCGYCVEACPVDAIRMDTGLHPEIRSSDPRSYIEDKDILLQRSHEIAAKDEKTIITEHLEQIRSMERRVH